MRLELGSGHRPTEGFVHLDVRDGPQVDLVDDASTLELVDERSCDEIRACHLLEHFSHRDTLRILRVWGKRLKTGGTLYVEVPNLAGHIKSWNQWNVTDEDLVTYLYGDQDYPENTHRTAFTIGTLRRAFESAGFKDIQMADFGLVIAAKGTR